jgi:hypothetical protein
MRIKVLIEAPHHQINDQRFVAEALQRHLGLHDVAGERAPKTYTLHGLEETTI